MRRLCILPRLGAEESGQDSAEYGIGLAIVAGFVVLVAFAIANDVQTLWSHAQQTVSSTVTAEGS